MEETESEVLTSGTSDYADLSDYGYSSTYDYMHDIDEFESEDFMSVKEKDDEYHYHRWDQFGDEPGPLPLSLESEREHLDSRNLPFGSKPHVALEFESSNLCTINRVLARDGSVLPRVEGKRAQVDEAFCTATSALNDSKSTDSLLIDITSHDLEYETIEARVDCDLLKESSVLPDLSDFTETSSACSYKEPVSAFQMHFDSSCLTRDYDYMNDIDEFMSVEEEGEMCEEPSPLPSSLVPETSQSSYEMLDNSFMCYPLAVTDFGVQKSEGTSVLLEFESLVESEPELRNTWSMLRTLLDQANPYCLTRAPTSSFEPYHALHAVTWSQHFMVRSARASSLEIICASWRRSCMNFGDGVERSALDVICVHAGAVDLPIVQVPLRDLHETSIQRVPKLDLECLTRVFKLKFVSAPPYESSTMGSIPQMSRIEIPSCSMLIHSGFDLNVESMQQAPDLVLIHAESDKSWMILSTPALDMSFERNNASLLTGVESGPLAKNSVSYSILSDKTVVFISSFPLSQREYVDYVLGIPLSTSIWKNGVRRACPLFIYLVIWAPKDYIARAARYFYGGWRAKVDRAEGHVIEFLWNCASFML